MIIGQARPCRLDSRIEGGTQVDLLRRGPTGRGIPALSTRRSRGLMKSSLQRRWSPSEDRVVPTQEPLEETLRDLESV